MLYIYIWGNFEKKSITTYFPKKYEDDGSMFQDPEKRYSDENIRKINSLRPGEVWKCENGNHHIYRIA